MPFQVRGEGELDGVSELVPGGGDWVDAALPLADLLAAVGRGGRRGLHGLDPAAALHGAAREDRPGQTPQLPPHSPLRERHQGEMG